ncbi:8-oxo-dGTP diphosphatase [Paenibacillus tianmuensis]|uniref:8-oxo-dGTP diphosphatase n=1 Tax=Paenibacillus tianmuensis TaxID=624147 RepID=A0A1G4TMU8_9BACL|nr:NUDIX domain-containing protein [Paenibacillus tianmuensis]SCW81909.1 8-oxo-dGTP diphosphatase [Paenibacillus tianmuensis]
MQGYNVLMIYNTSMDQLLMCKRLKDPYKGLSNLVGGKIESGETGIESAYRELLEETSITKEDVSLHHVMDFKYYMQNCYVEVYAGRLKHDITVSGEENELYWSDLKQNFFDMMLFAGEGNIGHMIEQVNMSKSLFLKD